jgi:carboxyl-terminal processing protease
MSQRKILAVIGLLSLIAIALGVGYISYPLLHPTSEPSAVSEPPLVAQEPVDMGLYWEVWHLLDRDFYGDPPDETEQVHSAVRGLVDSFDDPYTYFVEPQPRELERDQLRGSFGGIGAFIEPVEEGYILKPMRGQPADQAGVQDGDLLLFVDDAEITPALTLDEITALVRGPVGEDVRLVVRREVGDADHGNVHDEELTIVVTRTRIETPSVTWEIRDDGKGDQVGVITQSIFSERSAEEMRAAIRDLMAEGADRFILDLRGNPGGLVTAAIEIADMWLDDGLILIEEKADGSRTTFEAEPGQLTANAPLVVLVDGASASAAEIVAGALQDQGRAQLIGQRTFGKGSVQLIHELSDKSSLHVTNAEWLTPDGHAITGAGLTPDQPVAEGEDPLASALELLQGVPVANAQGKEARPTETPPAE